jgi:hypothetical protein
MHERIHRRQSVRIDVDKDPLGEHQIPSFGIRLKVEDRVQMEIDIRDVQLQLCRRFPVDLNSREPGIG